MAEYLETTIDKFIFRVATDRLYSPSGVWAMPVESGGGARVRIGLSDYLQQLNGDMAFAHLKPVGEQLAVDEEFAELETIKATVSAFTPVAGKMVEVNTELDLAPEIINQDPYGKGWLADIEAANWEVDRAKLLDPEAYLAAMQTQAEEELKKQ